MTAQEVDNLFNKQYLRGGGFCGYCGEGCEPYVKGGDEEMFGKCPYNGTHPHCTGDHDLQFVEKTPDVFGAYEIWSCRNEGCDYQEAI